MTGDEFFDATPQLQTIRQWAHARFAAKWAVFLAVLLRVHASTSPGVQLPGVIGGPASLNLIGAFVSPSGGGKGISDKVARLAWPTPIIERPIGSGEGIAALFAPPKKEGVERITQAIINVSEIDSLTGIASRQGSILLAQLKAAVMGELIGQSNASEATTRVVLPHSYRCVMSVGAQPGHCDVIFNDTSGGTPQRVLWVPTTDPDMPADPPDDPAPLETSLPAWSRTTDTVEIQYGPSEIREQIIAAHLARQRGEANALDGHRMLTRCKVAAGLAIMHHRSVISELDWQLSETVMAVSDSTRDWIVNEARRAARAKAQDRAMARAVGEEFIDQRRLDVVKRRVLKVLADGRISRGDLRARMGKKEYRELLEAAIAELAANGMITRIEATQGGAQLELNPEFSPESEFSPDIGRSEALNREFSPELQATVTHLDSRRSADSPRPKVTAVKWFADHIDELQAAGHTTVPAFAVYQAGEAAGYTMSTLANAARAHPDIAVIDRAGGRVTWSITPDRQHTYRPVRQWLDDYLDTLGRTEVTPDEVRIAGQAAGYGWETVRATARDSPRIQSVPARGRSKSNRIWHIINPPTDGEESA
ncbi:hypothetical protein [Mycolicibacterium monacense]|uniref:DUF3987 domain-containing protein n=1 Tax=Mycolicibacterium monacense TaxID=85693 RepID=A0AAD1IZK1_MYCMB|nr:hypothetical protein [Mycolicibacterium monacense]MDA4103516.1 hypothetical protein [Mycolicibacterium monacense DSM 44395]ORB12713.1 hypothetical protein BST34_26320 [Mycolicibacterium monacense DSM 44395]QHP83883.1 hypothetical protein EWR22_00085 [Mycolicibacterium monacense DSM 44395]BBZ63423.1 hypothetical protein MMON_47240 [Mycolicibacterium monacense]